MNKSKHLFWLFFLVLFCFVNILYSQPDKSQEKYSKVKIYATTTIDFNRISNAGLHFDGGIYKPGLYFETWLSESEIKMLKESGVPYDVTIPDWMEYYNSISQMSPQQIQKQLEKSKADYNVSHSIFGTVGGNLSWPQIKMKLDSMRLLWPTLISQRFSIGNTFENDSMWTVRVTKNPDAPTGRPEVWLNGVTHAREPGGMMNVFYYLYWLFENYNIDPVATYILNNREIYFTPVMNPDGYKYNIQTNPTGGGMHRKNRNTTYGGSGTAVGVDLNRNYGTYNFWNSTNGGSSTSTSNETYRGPSPFSEPETQRAKNFINSRNIRTSLSYHTYGNYLIKPWAWCDPNPTPDNAIFNQFGADMIVYNGFLYGTPYQTVAYYVRGSCSDFFYSTDSTGHTLKDFDMTPEVGSLGFWSSPTLILTEAESCIWMNIYYSLVAGAYVGVNSNTFNKSNYTQNETGNLKVVFKNKGLMIAQNVQIQYTPLSTYVTIPTQVYTRPSVVSFATDSVTFNFTVSGTCPNGYAIPTKLTIKQNDTVTVYSQNLYVLVGQGTSILIDSAENGFGNWTTNVSWGIVTTQYHSPSHSFTDSPVGNYADNTNNSMTVNFPINASTRPVLFLNFWHKYTTEAGYDYCYVEISSNNGTTWTQAATYNGTLSTWTQVSLNISSLANSSANLRIRFRLTSDANTNADGWYVDDIQLLGYNSLTNIGNENIIPDKYSLEQNYPNPFNPVTTIKFAIPKENFVTITIFDITGREVTRLLSENKQAGTYSVLFNAENLASGVYYYKIEAGNFSETKKMLMIK